MKKFLLFSMAACMSIVMSAQCDNDYDFGEVEFGVAPDPALGEEFDQAVINEFYSDTINLIVPLDAGVVNEAFTGFTIDSLSLDGVFVTIDSEQVDLSTIGLEIICNNNGDSPNPCTLMGGNQYCALVQGTPNIAGDLPLQINVTGYLLFLGEVQNIPFSFDGYTLTILDPNEIIDVPTSVNSVSQNIPNPFAQNTKINYSLTNSGIVTFEVSNILGEIVYEEIVQGRRGNNSIDFNGAEFESGIYLYSIEANNSKVTKKMIIR